MTTNATPTKTPLHDRDWTRSASGRALRTQYRSLHISIWRRPQGGPLQFTISGRMPERITTTTEAIALLWDRLVRHLGREAA
jgi:hypothetical protein